MSVKLIFKGLKEETEENLRILRATFISELEYSVEETTEFLANTPCLLEEAETEEDLIDIVSVLEKIGADFSVEGYEEEYEVEYEDDDEEILMEFNLGGDEEDEKIDTSKVKDKGQVYTIPDMESEQEVKKEPEEGDSIDETAVDDLVKQLETSVQVEKSAHPTLEEIARPHLGQSKKEKEIPNLEIEGLKDKKEEVPEPDIKEERTPEIKKGKKKSRFQLSDEILITIFISSFMLAVGAYLLKDYLREQISHIEDYRQKTLLAEKTRLKKEKLKEAEATGPQKKVVKAKNYTVTDTDSRRELSVSCEILKDKLTAISFNLNTPEPPPLTDIEIVENAPEPSWLEHMQPTGDLLIQKSEVANFLAAGSVKAFIRHDKIKSRFQGRIVITGKYDKDSDSVSIDIMINRGFSQIPDTDFAFERISRRNHTFFLKEQLTLSKEKKKP